MSIFDGPGSFSPLLKKVSSTRLSQLSKCSNCFSNSNCSFYAEQDCVCKTRNIICSTHVCYIMFKLSNIVDDYALQHVIVFKNVKRAANDIIHLNSNNFVFKYNTNNIIPSTHSKIIKLESDNYISLTMSRVNVFTSNILDCVFGGLFIVEHIQNSYVTRLSLCDRDNIYSDNKMTCYRGSNLLESYSIHSSTSNVYIAGYHYKPYNNISVIIKAKMGYCVGLFIKSQSPFLAQNDMKSSGVDIEVQKPLLDQRYDEDFFDEKYHYLYTISYSANKSQSSVFILMN